jgi:hypothetical protein
MTTFRDTMMLLTLKRQNFVHNFVILKNYAKYGLDPVRDWIRNRNRNKSLRFKFPQHR